MSTGARDLVYEAFGPAFDFDALTLLHQGRLWTGKTGETFFLADLDRESIHQLLEQLKADSAKYWQAAVRKTMLDIASDGLLGQVNADLLARQLGDVPVEDMNPEQWLETTELVRTLRRALRSLTPPSTGQPDPQQ